MATSGRYQIRHTKLRDHILNQKTGSRECELQVGGGLKLTRPAPVTYYLQGGRISRPSPNSITQWGPSVQMLRTRRDISHSNHRNPHLGTEERGGNSHSSLNQVDPIFQPNNRTKETQNHPFTNSEQIQHLSSTVTAASNFKCTGNIS